MKRLSILLFTLALTSVAKAQVATQHVATNADLKALATAAAPNGIWRDDFAVGYGASPLWFTPNVGTCAANGLISDDGYCTDTVAGDGNSWRAWHPQPDGVNVLQFGGDLTGAADSAPKINAVMWNGNRKVVIPCGTFKLLSALRVPNNTDIGGNGPCTVLKSTTALAVNPDWSAYVFGVAPNVVKNFIANADFQNGNKNIHIHNMRIDGTGAGVSGKVIHMVSFVRSSNFEVDHMDFIGDAVNDFVHDGLNAVEFNHDFRFHDNHADGIRGAVADVWGGAYNFSIDHNRCTGHAFLSYCVVINGTSSGGGVAYQSRNTYNWIVDANISYDTQDGGIGVFGLTAPDGSGNYVTGDLHDGKIRGNIVDTVRDHHGMKIGETYRVSTTDNLIKNVPWACIDTISSPNAPDKSLFHDNIIADNTCQDVNTASQNPAGPTQVMVPAIQIGDAAGVSAPHDNIVARNRIIGTAHAWGIRNYAGALRTSLSGNQIDPGLFGTLVDAGADTTVDGAKHWRLSASFGVANSAALVDAGPSVEIVKGKYAFEFDGNTIQGSAGGAKLALAANGALAAGGGIAELDYTISAICNGMPLYYSGRLVALGASLSVPAGSGCGAASWRIHGTIIANAGGALKIQLAQDQSYNTPTSLLRGGLLKASQF